MRGGEAIATECGYPVVAGPHLFRIEMPVGIISELSAGHRQISVSAGQYIILRKCGCIFNRRMTHHEHHVTPRVGGSGSRPDGLHAHHAVCICYMAIKKAVAAWENACEKACISPRMAQNMLRTPSKAHRGCMA